MQYISRADVRASVPPPVNTFNLNISYKANRDQILSKESLRRGKGCVRLLTRSDQDSSFHGNR